LIQACLFDLGEVVVKTGFEKTFTKYKQQRNWNVEKLREKIFSDRYELLLCGKMDLQEFIDEIKEEVDISRAQLEEFARDYYFSGTPRQKVIDLITRIKSDCKVGVITNDIGKLEEKLAYLDLADLFSEVINSYQVGYCKPEVKFYQAVLDKLNLKGEEVLYIDNDSESLSKAKQVGIIPLYFVNPAQLEEKLKQFQVI
jgi:HAD superfamily hydrolase (TIGR01509 family)